MLCMLNYALQVKLALHSFNHHLVSVGGFYLVKEYRHYNRVAHELARLGVLYCAEHSYVS